MGKPTNNTSVKLEEEVYKAKLKEKLPKRGRFTGLLDTMKSRMYSTEHESYLEMQGAELCDDKGKPVLDENGNPKYVNVRVKMPNREAFVTHTMARAMQSDKVLIDLWNRLEGYPVQKTETKEVQQKTVRVILEGDDRHNSEGQAEGSVDSPRE